MTWELLCAVADPTLVRLRATTVVGPRPGEVRLTVDRFTADLGFGDVFPAPPGFRRPAVWAQARVAESRVAGIAVGDRVHGVVPAGSDHVLSAAPAGNGFVDTAHAFLPPFLPAEPDHADLRTVFGAAFATAFPLALVLERAALRGAKSVLLTGADGVPGIVLADLLASDTDLLTVGLTTPDAVEFTRGPGGCDDAVTPDDLAAAPLLAPAVLVDLTGDPRLVGRIHRALHDDLAHTVLAGHTRPSAVPARWRDRYHASQNRFLRTAAGWVSVSRHSGPEAVARRYGEPGFADVFLP